MRLPVPGPVTLGCVGLVCLPGSFLLAGVTGGKALGLLAVPGGLSLYMAVLWMFNLSGAWDIRSQQRRSASKGQLWLLGLTRNDQLDAPWITAPLTFIAGVALVALGIYGAIHGRLP